MKHAKRFAAALLAVLMLAALLAVPGMATEPGEPAGDARDTKVSTSIDASAKLLTETLTVGDYCYLPKITYTLKLGAGNLYLSTGFGSDDESDAYFSLGDDFLTGVNNQTLATVVFGGDEGSGYYAQYTGIQEGQWNLNNNSYPRNFVAPDDYVLPYWLNADTVDAINALKFDRACVLWFPILKTVDAVNDYYFGTKPTDGNPTNYNHSSTEDTGTALVIFVPGAAAGPGVPVVGVYALDEEWNEPTFDITTATMPTKITNYADEYDPDTKSLTIGKTVTGSLGDFDRYFRFDVTFYGFGEGFNKDVLDAMIRAGYLVTKSAEIVSDNSVSTVTATKYDNEDFDIGFSNLNPVDYVTEVNVNSSVTFTFWLKHGETITIQNIPDFLNSYDVLEESDNISTIESEGYTTSYVIAKVVDDEGTTVTDEDTQESNGFYYEDWADTYDRTVTFTNDRDVATPTPTGVSLQAVAPIAGVVIALGLGAVVLLGRKRRGNGSF
ncbi:MAG: hypothetical protein IKP82_08310 [Oscillospiraceae bacterium]|nr:hypothetical protein [Oscillospiraceae bacterium]